MKYEVVLQLPEHGVTHKSPEIRMLFLEKAITVRQLWLSLRLILSISCHSSSGYTCSGKGNKGSDSML